MKNLTIGTKLALTLASLVSIAVIIASMGVVLLAASNSRFDSFINGVNLRTHLVEKVRIAVDKRALATRELLLQTNDEHFALEQQAFRAANIEVQDYLARLKISVQGRDVPEESRNMVAAIEAIERQYALVSAEIVQLVSQGEREIAIRRMEEACRPLLARLTAAADDYSIYASNLADLMVVQAHEAYRHQRDLFIFAVVLAALLSLVAGVMIVRSLLADLGADPKYLRELLTDITKGSLSQTLRLRKGDTNSVLAAVSHMQQSMIRNADLEQQVRFRTKQVQQMQDATILAMASLAETRDNETGNHILRTQSYVGVLARHLKDHPRFANELTDEAIELIVKSAPLHDIGKIGIPDHILLKPGKLTPEEFAVMKTHTTLGLKAIEKAEQNMEGDHRFLRYAKEIAHSHQEKWDGSGYPLGLAGEAIPVSARLMALADVYDALISVRVYKKAFSHDEACQMIIDGRGRHFDPDVTEAFIANIDAFAQIARRFSDERPSDAPAKFSETRLLALA